VPNVSEATRQRILALLRQHGREATCFQILEPGLSYWFHEGAEQQDAVIAYADVGGAWVTVGEPVCAPERMTEVVAAFERTAREQDKRLRFFHVSESFTGATGLRSTHIGEQPVWDPSAWPQTLSHHRSLREQLKRAQNKGVSARLVPGSEFADPASATRRGCEVLIARWLSVRRLGEMKFMVLVHPFEFAEERRFALAEQDGKLVGLAVAIPVYAQKGWFIEDLLRDPAAPNGTAELLVDALFRAFAAEGSHYATLGLAPLSGELGRMLTLTRDTTNRLYNFTGVRAFKEKLRPQRWDPVHLAFPRGELGLVALRDVLAAFAPGGLIPFAVNSLVHQRRLATLLLATLLVPWTIALSVIDSGRWFPSHRVHTAWVALDVILIGLMFSLVRRWRSRVAGMVVALTTLDALLTTIQTLLWNVWTTQGALEWMFVILGCTGPLLAAAFFWATRLVSVRSLLQRPMAST
jgi:phosphatidylglycerol lysyltransferase